MSALSKDQLREWIASARKQHQAGAGTVLDVLRRNQSGAQIDWAEALRSLAGVQVLSDQEAVSVSAAKLSFALAKQWGAAVLRDAAGSSPRVLMADPWDLELVKQVSQRLGVMPVLVAASTEQLTVAWRQLEANSGVSQAAAASSSQGGGTLPALASPVVLFVDEAIRAAYREGASDIHFECDRKGVQVKFRQDGVMVAYASMQDPARAEEVISRIKVLAQLDITERRTPQDGRFRFQMDAADIDLRVSIMPSVFGEDAVLRLLDKAQLRTQDASITLDLLGFSANHVEQIRELAELPHGMLLVTGPTGSGKTTTVYAMLSEVNTGLEKIITIEDPVEYELSGVLQIPVNERKGLTFAKGLRSILRHDPDRILVGEIRDAETAEIAVQSALTGHQVLTTVHANSIYDVTGRFRHFGLDIFGFMSALNGVIVQRLVRKLCVHCRLETVADDRAQRWLQRHGVAQATVYKPVGCSVCHGHGYNGRSVLAEIHAIDDGFRDLVTGDAPVSAMREHIMRGDHLSLAQQAVEMVLSGLTSPEEIKRVVGWQ